MYKPHQIIKQKMRASEPWSLFVTGEEKVFSALKDISSVL